MTILNKEKILEQARAFIDEGKYDKAIREYEKILLAEPSDLRVKLKIAELYTKRKQITDAIRIYREVADAYAAEGFYLKAVTVHKNILRLNPALVEINEQLALLYEKMGLIGDAIRQYDILASAFDTKGQTDRALEIRKRVVKLDPKDINARVRLAELYQRERRMDDAIDQYEEYAKQVEETGGDTAKLADVLEKILSHRPDRPEMLRKLINICKEAGDQKRMLKWLDLGKTTVERDTDLLRLMAETYAAQNQFETACAKYYIMADLFREMGDVDSVMDAYCEILALVPDEEDRVAKKIEEIKPDGLSDVMARATRRREEIAAEEIRKQEALDAAKEGASRQVKEPVAAKPEFKKSETKKYEIIKEQPPFSLGDADAAFALGKMYRQTGLKEEAVEEFKKAKRVYETIIGINPGDSNALKRIAEIDVMLGTKIEEAKTENKSEAKPEQQAPSKKKRVSFV